MTTEFPVLIELSPAPGSAPVSFLDKTDLAQKSARAIEHAMQTVQQLSIRMSAAIGEMVEAPGGNTPMRVEMTFGLKLNAEADVLITKSGMESTFEVKLTWEKAKNV